MKWIKAFMVKARQILFGSLQLRNFWHIFVITLVPIIVLGGIMYYNIISTANKDVAKECTGNLSRKAATLDTLIRGVKMMAAQMAKSPEAMIYIYSGNNAMDEAGTRLYNQILYYSVINTYVDSIYVYSNIHKKALSKEYGDVLVADMADIGWLNLVSKGQDPYYNFTARKKNGNYPKLITIASNVLDDKKNILGAIIININREQLAELFDEPESQGWFYAVDEHDNILYGSQNQFEGSNISSVDYLKKALSNESSYTGFLSINGKKYITAVDASQYNSWRYVNIIPETIYSQQILYVNGMLMYLVIISIILLVLVSGLIAFNTYRPIKSILAIVQNPKLEYTNGVLNDSQEIKEVAASIGRMVYMNTSLEKELSNNITLLNRAQVSALQAQLNPHFLFNTLNAINWLILDEGIKHFEASKMIIGVSKFLRFGLDLDENIIPLKTEREYTELYIDIMKIRYVDIFEVTWEIEKEIEDAKVLKLFLQPLIENAVSHGIQPKGSNGKIIIKGQKSDNYLKISVIDDGVGIDKDSLDKLQEALRSDYSWTGRHVGIRNLNQRIKLLFDGDHGINVMSDSNGTTIEIIMPIIY